MKLEALLATAALVPSLPEAVAQVLAELQQEEPDLRRVNALLSTEVGLTVRLLRLVNSARYARGTHRIGTIESATALIGLHATRQLVAAAAVGGAFRNVPGVDLTDFWRFSLDVAKLAETLAGELQLDGGQAFTAGLLHGSGDLIMKMAMPDRPSLQPPFPIDSGRHAAQNADLGYSYADVVAAFTARWQFPDTMVAALAQQCTPHDDDGASLASVLYLAAWSARAHELDLEGEALFDRFPHDVAASAGLTDSGSLRGELPFEWTGMDEARAFGGVVVRRPCRAQTVGMSYGTKLPGHKRGR